MKTSNLRINQLSATTYERYLAYLHAIDNKDIEAYGRFLAEDVTMQFNNDTPRSGKTEILQGLTYYWQSFGEVEHDLNNIYGSNQNWVLEALNHYVRHDGKKVTIHAVAFTDLDENGLVKSVRIYQDVSPVFI
ncbi:MAG: nuclear transport factor 2 family protein [Saprospiraceae bacterium]